MLNLISLGAGVQSSTMALMAAQGDISPMPDGAIFADTQNEPIAVYHWLEWLEKRLPFPVHRVTAGNLRQMELRIIRSRKSGKLYMKNSIPAFILKSTGKHGLLGRKCTTDFKIIPIQRKVKELAGVERGGSEVLCIMWVGISYDEVHRMKPSRVPYIENVWPLIDKKMKRRDCLEWMKEQGYPEPPRSACTFCPFHSDEEWRKIRDTTPDEFAEVVKFERDLITTSKKQEVLQGTPYLHESCIPIDQVVFQDRPDHTQLSMFGSECEGLCGV